MKSIFLSIYPPRKQELLFYFIMRFFDTLFYVDF